MPPVKKPDPKEPWPYANGGGHQIAPTANAVKDWDTGKHRVVERSRTRQSLDLPRRSPNSGEFGYKESVSALPNGAALEVRATPLGFSFSGESVSQGCASFAALTSLHPGLI